MWSIRFAEKDLMNPRDINILRHDCGCYDIFAFRFLISKYSKSFIVFMLTISFR